MENQEVTRSSTILKDRWEGFKDEITFLYLDCGCTLQEVMEFMKGQHSFHAKEKQYKDKFRDWNLRKNLTKAQKLDLYTYIQLHGGVALAEQSPDASGARISKVYMLTFNCMGVLFERRGDLTERTRYYRSALEWSTNIVLNEALNGEDKRRRVKWLEDVVRYHTLNGDVLEVQSLCEQYHDLWTELNQKEVGGLVRTGAGT
ncbi:uncharacterized protein A1O9_08075 [Exophiala aquamarina CBS 119918]|uniref:Clr5 domain-containing protein n=1 Tax=Exophiala aquamarina CBS 119918 TaxID=1182545 RepID=A0A072P8Q6_9EURO|nr:uncharacterized protein A1O9_08075 [Exophiala aquamarina CBS 119918]KEF56494.1 hypothetical protein A1O9_08075 [Exophiala aquamarina CBS 119918]